MYNTTLIWLIISKYFGNLSSTLIVHNSSWSSDIYELYLETTQTSFQSLSRHGHPIRLHWLDIAELNNGSVFKEVMLNHVNMAIEGYISILPSLEEFLHTRYYATVHSVQRQKDKYYLFLSEDEDPTEVLAEDVLNWYPHHLLVSAAMNSTDFELWTQKFVGAKDNLRAVHLDTFYENGSFAKGVELYPNKLMNLQGRTMEVSSITYIPYVISYFVAEGDGDVDCIDPALPKKSIVYTGTEPAIVLSFCRLRNCVVKVIPYGNDNWGAVYKNGSSDGMIGSVYRRDSEFGIGSYYNWYDDIFETSIAIAKSAVTLLGPAPSRYPAYLTIVLPFNKLIWSLIILSIVLGSIVMHWIKFLAFWMENYDKKTKPRYKHSAAFRLTMFQTFSIFLQQSFSQSKLDRFVARFFLSCLLFAGITLENTYSGQLKSLLTIPALTDPVDTIEKFALTDWKWATPSDVWVLSINDSDISYEQTMAKKFEVLNYDQLRKASHTGRYGLALERLHGGTYGFGDYIRDGALDQMILTKDDLYFEWTRAIALRGWALMEEFNTHILWCLEHGLYNYWERRSVFKFLDKRAQAIMLDLESGHSPNFPPMALTVTNISGPLIALLFGYAFAFFALLFEVFAERIKVVLKFQINENFAIHAAISRYCTTFRQNK